MGIIGFENFYSRNAEKCFTDVSVRNEILVIDGSEIIYEIYDICSDRACYDEFYDQMIKFFAILASCGIKPIVVMDGHDGKYEESGTKYKERRQGKIRYMAEALETNGNSRYAVEPPALIEVFHEAAEASGVTVVYSIKPDADTSTAALANLLNAKVLASDTIYAVLNLRAGFLPLKCFPWKTARDDTASGIEAKLYTIDDFSRSYGINNNAVQYLNIFFGRNSPFSENLFSVFMEKFKGRGKNPNILNFLIWMGQRYNTDDELIGRILPTLTDQSNVTAVRNHITLAIDECRYPRMFKAFRLRVLDQIKDEELKTLLQSTEYDGADDPDDFDSAQYDIPNSFYQVLKQILRDIDPVRRNLTLILSSPDKPSPNDVSKDIRRQQYQLMVVKEETTVMEFDRVGEEYKKVADIIVRRPNDVHPALQDVYMQSVENNDFTEYRKNHILSILVGDNSVKRFEENCMGINAELQLLLAASIFWIQKASPGENAISALAFTVCSIYLDRKNPEKTGIKSNISKLKASYTELNVDYLQLSGQWQACLVEASRLNHLLRFPLLKPVWSKLFNGTLFEASMAAVENGTSIEELIAEISGGQLYDNLMRVLTEKY